MKLCHRGFRLFENFFLCRFCLGLLGQIVLRLLCSLQRGFGFAAAQR